MSKIMTNPRDNIPRRNDEHIARARSGHQLQVVLPDFVRPGFAFRRVGSGGKVTAMAAKALERARRTKLFWVAAEELD